MGATELLAMSRYLVLMGAILALARAVRDIHTSSIRYGLPFSKIARRQARNLWLVGIAAYYVRALYIPGYDQPGSMELALINFLLAGYFIFTTVPRFRRESDEAQETPQKSLVARE